MFSIRKWLATKVFAQAAGQASRRRFLDGVGPSGAFGLDTASLHGNTLLRFYYADEELNQIAAELDSFDGKRDPVRCSNLVNHLRAIQDKVISLLFQLMDEWGCERADRTYRQKFPDDLLTGTDNGESLNGQIWFGAECLAAGSNILNHEQESEMLRPLAKSLTNTLDHLRMELRHACSDIDDHFYLFKDILSYDLTAKMEHFDRLFTGFEFDYVSAMLPIKTADEIEKIHELTILFSEAVVFALQRKLLLQDDLDTCQPKVMVSIPRLSILHGLARCSDGPLIRKRKEHLPVMFKPFHSLLHRVRDLVLALRPCELELLEKMLVNEDSSSTSENTKDDIADLIGSSPADRDDDNSSSSDGSSSSEAATPSTHKRRHSAPDSYPIRIVQSVKISRSASATSLTTPVTPSSILTTVTSPTESSATNSAASSTTNSATSSTTNSPTTSDQLTSQESSSHLEVKRGTDRSSTVSIATTTASQSTVDSFELSLALAAKNSSFISSGTRALLQRLFVTIAGIADQLQSNCAADLRMILRTVFAMHTSSSDEEDTFSIDEAFEAQEEARSDTSSSSSSSVTTPTTPMTSNSVFAGGRTCVIDERDGASTSAMHYLEHLPSSSGQMPTRDSNNYDRPPPQRRNDSELCDDEDLNLYEPVRRSSRRRHHANHDPSDNGVNSVLIAPVWVPDELVSCCTGCTMNFTLIRRRHHCRNCGGVFCNSCTSQTMPLVHFGYEKAVRVCRGCYDRCSGADDYPVHLN